MTIEARRRINAVLTVVVVLALVAAAMVMAWFPSAGRLSSIGKELEFPAKLLDTHLYTVERAGDAVRLVTDGTLGQTMEPDGRFWQSTFLINTRQEFYSLPSRHGDTRFRIERIVDDGVDISYSSRQRQAIPGQGMTEVDHGVLHLQWRHRRSPYDIPPRAGGPAR